MRGFELLEPRSVEEACQFLSRYGEEAKVLAGGTALVKLMKKRLVHPSYLVDMKGIPGLNHIRQDEYGLKIGALTTLSEVETSVLVQQRFRAVSEMVHTIGSVQIRNVGTLVGNLCFGDPASDPAPLLIALGATLKIGNLGEGKIFPLEGFFRDFYQTALRPDEIVEEIQIPSFPKYSGAVYLRHATRAGFDPAIVGVAVVLSLDDKKEVCQDAKIVLGGVASTPLHVKTVEDLLKGKAIADSLITKAAVDASKGIDPIQDVRASADYRREMIKVFLARAVRKALDRAKGGQGV